MDNGMTMPHLGKCQWGAVWQVGQGHGPKCCHTTPYYPEGVGGVARHVARGQVEHFKVGQIMKDER